MAEININYVYNTFTSSVCLCLCCQVHLKNLFCEQIHKFNLPYVIAFIAKTVIYKGLNQPLFQQLIDQFNHQHSLFSSGNVSQCKPASKPKEVRKANNFMQINFKMQMQMKVLSLKPPCEHAICVCLPELWACADKVRLLSSACERECTQHSIFLHPG